MNNLKNIKDYFWWLLYSTRQKIIRKLSFPEISYHKKINNIFEIETHRIKYLAGGPPQKKYRLRRTDMNLVLGGNWEFYGNKVEEDPFYLAAKQHFIDKKPWTRTFFVQNQLKSKSKIELLRYLKDKTKLFYSMKANGYLSNIKLNLGFKTSRFTQGWSEIAIHIGKEGKFSLCQGRHRLFYAYLLNIPSVKVNVIVRHKKWYRSSKNQDLFK